MTHFHLLHKIFILRYVKFIFESEAILIKNNISNQTFKDIKNEITNFTKDGFDFIFHDKAISGVTFKELSEDTKQKIVEIIDKIDNQIMTYNPDYKEHINNQYENIVNKSKEMFEKGKKWLNSKKS